jgi:hypothetical protein
MRFMVMHKVDAKMEAGERPDETIIQGMGQFIGRSLKAGVFEDGAGLHPSASRVRLVFEDGQRTVVRGPYQGSNELLASFALIVATSVDHAIELATRLAGAGGDREIEIGPVVEGWDLTGKPRPADAPYRYLLLRKADAGFEAGAPRPAGVQRVLDEWKRDGVLQSAAMLAPSKTGARTRVTGGKRVWTDGPFTESKELVAGFSIINVPALADAKVWAEEYAGILGDNEVDVREVAGA